MAKVKEIEKNKVEIEFEIDKQAFAQAEQQAYLKMRGKINVPGFRKGKAPKAVIKNMYGEGVFFEDALDIAFPGAYESALTELDLFAVSQPENIDIVSVEEPITLKAQVYTKPDVELGEYKGLKVEYVDTKVTEEDIEKKLESIREQNARFETVERAAANGDKVIIDYAGSVDGVPFDGGTAEQQTLDIGSGMFIPGFEEQVVGMTAGEEKDIAVTFPEKYHSAELAGKDAVFKVKLHEVKEKKLPELDDEFAQDVSEFDTFAEYKADTVKKLKGANEAKVNADKENAMFTKIIEAAKVDIPACMIDSRVEMQIQEMATNLMYQGMNLDMYLNYLGTNLEDMKKTIRPQAETQVKSQLVTKALVDAEKIEATDDDIKEFLAPRAEKEGKSVEEIIEGMKDQGLEYIKERVVVDKLVKLLKENNEFIAKEPEMKKEGDAEE